MGKLEGIVALITGAGSGICAATAKELTDANHAAIGIPTDVSDSDSVKDAVAQTVDPFGRLDILVPNAGIQMHNINYRGVYHATKHGLAQFVKQGDGGVVIIVSSVADTKSQNRSCSGSGYEISPGEVGTESSR